MALIGTLTTEAALQQAFSDYVNEDSPPASTEVLYLRRRRWFNRGREDLSRRFFFRSLRKSNTISILAGDDGPYALPDDLTVPNALVHFETRSGGVIFTDPYETGGNTFSLSRNFTTGLYQVTLDPAPASADTADIEYYATPTPMDATDDLVLVDGECVLFFALRQHFLARGAAAIAELDQVTQELENRVQELLRMDAIAIPGSSTQMRNYEKARHISEKSFYGGNTRRS